MMRLLTKAEIALARLWLRMAHAGDKKAWADRGVTVDPRIAAKRGALASKEESRNG